MENIYLVPNSAIICSAATTCQAQVSSALGMISDGGSRNLDENVDEIISQKIFLPVSSGVSQLNAVDIRNASNSQGPVKRCSRSSVENTGDAANLVELAVSVVQSFIATVAKI